MRGLVYTLHMITLHLVIDADLEPLKISTEEAIQEMTLDFNKILKEEMTLDKFKEKWKVTELRELARYHCGFGYTSLSHPEKSYLLPSERLKQIKEETNE